MSPRLVLIRQIEPMSRSGTLNIIHIAVFGILLVGCSRKKASDEIDFGEFVNSVYTNKYFGLSVTVPSDWSIQDQEARQRLMNVGVKMVAGEDKNLKAAIKASEPQTVSLLAAFRHPVGSPLPFNPNIMVIGEMVRQWPGIQRGKDYHFQVKQTLQNSQMEVSFPGEDYTERVGGAEFDVLDQELKIRGLVVKQRYHTIIKKGYALSVILSFTSDQEEAALRKVLETVSLR
jgi:hypothetical protein